MVLILKSIICVSAVVCQLLTTFRFFVLFFVINIYQMVVSSSFPGIDVNFPSMGVNINIRGIGSDLLRPLEV